MNGLPIGVCLRHQNKDRLVVGAGPPVPAVRKGNSVDERLKTSSSRRARRRSAASSASTSARRSIGTLASPMRSLLALPRYRQNNLFAEREKLALDYTVAVMRTPVEVSDELFVRMNENFTARRRTAAPASLRAVAGGVADFIAAWYDRPGVRPVATRRLLSMQRHCDRQAHPFLLAMVERAGGDSKPRPPAATCSSSASPSPAERAGPASGAPPDYLASAVRRDDVSVQGAGLIRFTLHQRPVVTSSIHLGGISETSATKYASRDPDGSGGCRP
jgi:hypothetical protein